MSNVHKNLQYVI
jgi:hypothetical protein